MVAAGAAVVAAGAAVATGAALFTGAAVAGVAPVGPVRGFPVAVVVGASRAVLVALGASGAAPFVAGAPVGAVEPGAGSTIGDEAVARRGASIVVEAAVVAPPGALDPGETDCPPGSAEGVMSCPTPKPNQPTASAPATKAPIVAGTTHRGRPEAPAGGGGGRSCIVVDTGSASFAGKVSWFRPMTTMRSTGGGSVTGARAASISGAACFVEACAGASVCAIAGASVCAIAGASVCAIAGASVCAIAGASVCAIAGACACAIAASSSAIARAEGKRASCCRASARAT